MCKLASNAYYLLEKVLHYNEQLLVYLKVIHWTSLCPEIPSPALTMPYNQYMIILLNCVHVQSDERIKEHRL